MSSLEAKLVDGDIIKAFDDIKQSLSTVSKFDIFSALMMFVNL